MQSSNIAPPIASPAGFCTGSNAHQTRQAGALSQQWLYKAQQQANQRKMAYPSAPPMPQAGPAGYYPAAPAGSYPAAPARYYPAAPAGYPTSAPYSSPFASYGQPAPAAPAGYYAYSTPAPAGVPYAPGQAQAAAAQAQAAAQSAAYSAGVARGERQHRHHNFWAAAAGGAVGILAAEAIAGPRISPFSMFGGWGGNDTTTVVVNDNGWGRNDTVIVNDNGWGGNDIVIVNDNGWGGNDTVIVNNNNNNW